MIRNSFELFMRRGATASLSIVALLLASCSGNTNSSGPAAPLPNGQTGSIEAITANTANCYISNSSSAIASCSSTTPKGTYGITALAAGTVGTTQYLIVGDSAGHIGSTSGSTTLPSSPTSAQITSCNPSTTTPITALAFTSTATYYASSGGLYSAPLPCSTSWTPSSGSSTSITGLANVSGTVFGVTKTGSYFTVSSPATLTALPGINTPANITAIASVPNTSIVMVSDASQNQGQGEIYYFSASGSTLSFLGSYTGSELSYPSGIALFTGTNPTQNYCTIGPCTFMDIANPGNNTITQYVVSVSGTSVSINQFNNAYFDCDIINPSSIAALPSAPASSSSAGPPGVFIGENSINYSSSGCLGSIPGQYGNNVTAYGIVGE